MQLLFYFFKVPIIVVVGDVSQMHTIEWNYNGQLRYH